MNRNLVLVSFALSAAVAASGCKDPGSKNTKPVVPTPVSATVKPEVDVKTEVSSVESDDFVIGDDVLSFDGLSHLGQCEVDHLGVGRGLLESGMIDDGIEELERGVYDSPEDFETRRLLGEAYRGSGELELAVGHFRAALEQSEDARTWLLLAQTYYELKDADQAIVAIGKVTKMEPTNPEPFRLLAKVYQSKSMWKESVEASEEAIARGSDSPWTYNNMGYAYLVLGRYEEAVRELEKAVSFDEGVSPQIWNNLGLAYEKKGELRDAHAAYQAALAGNPNYVKAKVNVGRTMQLAKEQGIDLGTRTADISRTDMDPAVDVTPRDVPVTEPVFEIPADEIVVE